VIDWSVVWLIDWFQNSRQFGCGLVHRCFLSLIRARDWALQPAAWTVKWARVNVLQSWAPTQRLQHDVTASAADDQQFHEVIGRVDDVRRSARYLARVVVWWTMNYLGKLCSCHSTDIPTDVVKVGHASFCRRRIYTKNGESTDITSFPIITLRRLQRDWDRQIILGIGTFHKMCTET